jgi:hypothetical protein
MPGNHAHGYETRLGPSRSLVVALSVSRTGARDVVKDGRLRGSAIFMRLTEF